MATLLFRGDAPAVAQVDTLTVGGTIEATDIFIVAINGKNLSVVGGSTVADTVAAAIVAAFNALSATTYPEFAEITAAAVGGSTGQLTLTADTAGKPFTATVSTTETGGTAADNQTFTTAATTANSGPNAVVAANFRNLATGANEIPGVGDVVIFRNSAVALKYGLGTLIAASGTATYHFEASFTGQIGLPEINSDSSDASYNEYRTQWFYVDSNSITIGEGDGTGSSLLKLMVTDGDPTTVRVYQTGSSNDSSAPVKIASNNSTAVTITVDSGTVELSDYGGAYTVPTVTLYDGSLTVNAGGVTTATVYSGSLYVIDCATLTTYGGTVTTGPICSTTTATVYGGEVLFSGDSLTTVNAYAGTFTLTGGVTIAAVALNIGPTGTFNDLYGVVTTLTVTAVGGADLDLADLNIRKNKKLVITDP